MTPLLAQRLIAVPVFNERMLLDFGANIAMLALCVIGFRASPQGTTGAPAIYAE